MRLAKNLAYFLLGFLFILLARRAVVPPVPGPIEKATAPLLAERATCSVLIIGPSYVADQVVPEAFNREAERMGWDARACKYGTTALRGYELRLWIERFLARDWPRLELVLIDITLGDKVGFDHENWLNPRVVEWHTWGAVPWLLDYYERKSSMPLGEKVPILWAHGKHVLAHYAELGQGIDELGSLRLLERFRPEASSDASTRRSSGRGRKREKLRGAAYERHVQAMVNKRQTRGPALGRSEWALELRSVVRARGKEAYFLIAPVLYTAMVPKRSVVGPDRLVVLDFNDPERYPELYREEVRGNTSHLRHDGGVRYSELLARELRPLLGQRGRR